MLCEKSRIIKARSPPARILEIFNFSKFNREEIILQTIRYIFSDGTTSEVEVSDELYILHLELLQQKKRNYWKEARRHISLNYLTDNGIDFESPAADLLCRTA